VSAEESKYEDERRKKIAEPPLNILFNPSIVGKKNVWDINVSLLLEMLLNLLGLTGKKDLRVCGIAAVSSSMIHRLKVESIFNLEKIAMQRKQIEEPQSDKPIIPLNVVQLPFRFESTYPLSLEDLLQVLENMILDITNRNNQKAKLVRLDQLDTFDFDQYFVKLEQVIQEYENMVFDIVGADKTLMFKTIVSGMNPIEVARCFLAILHLATKRKIELEQVDAEEDIKITMTT
jgi:segregation and condensation protein A